MIFLETINKKASELRPAFDELFQLAFKNQVHEGDLLLVNENGTYNPDILKWNNFDEKFLPYTVGPDKEGFSEYVHFKFIDIYRKTQQTEMSYDEYLKQIEYDPEKVDDRNKIIFQEELSIHVEMLIYLKIWESDSFIKRMYELARLANGEKYDWHFKIEETNRDSDCTGTRQEIIRKKIRNKFEKILPNLYNSIKNSYRTQVRNSIAHSQYSFQSRYIHLNNFIERDKASHLKSLQFEDWINMFHETLVLYNEYIRFFNKVNSLYARIAQDNYNLIQVELNMKVPEDKIEYRYMEYRPEWNDFKLKLD